MKRGDWARLLKSQATLYRIEVCDSRGIIVHEATVQRCWDLRGEPPGFHDDGRERYQDRRLFLSRSGPVKDGEWWQYKQAGGHHREWRESRDEAFARVRERLHGRVKMAEGQVRAAKRRLKKLDALATTPAEVSP